MEIERLSSKVSPANISSIVMSPCYEVLRYGHEKIQNQVQDAHTAGKLAKLVIGPCDLIDESQPPAPGNFKFDYSQYRAVDIVIFVKNRENFTIEDRTIVFDEPHPTDEYDW